MGLPRAAVSARGGGGFGSGAAAGGPTRPHRPENSPTSPPPTLRPHPPAHAHRPPPPRSRQRVNESLRNKIFESLLNLTLFRAELSTEHVVTLLGLLMFLNFFHVVIETRVGMLEEHIDGFASVSRWGHARMLLLFVALCVADGLMLSSLTHHLSEQGASYLLLFAAEYMLQFLDHLRAGFRYLIAFQTARFGGAEAWPNRPLVLMSGKLIIDIARLAVSVTYFCILSVHFGLPVLLVRNLLRAAGDVRREGMSLLNARRLRVFVRTSLAPPTVEHLRHDALCAVCHEDIPERDAERETARRLACGHAFHINCLLSWWLRSITCPTCRADIDINAPPIPQAAPVAPTAAEVEMPADEMLPENAFVPPFAEGGAGVGAFAAGALPPPPVLVYPHEHAPVAAPVATVAAAAPAPLLPASATAIPAAATIPLSTTTIAAAVEAEDDGGWSMLPASPAFSNNARASSLASGGGGASEGRVMTSAGGGSVTPWSGGGGGGALSDAGASLLRSVSGSGSVASVGGAEGAGSSSGGALSAAAARELRAAAALARLSPSPPPLALPPPSPTASPRDASPREETSQRSALRSSLRQSDASPSPRATATSFTVDVSSSAAAPAITSAGAAAAAAAAIPISQYAAATAATCATFAHAHADSPAPSRWVEDASSSESSSDDDDADDDDDDDGTDDGLLRARPSSSFSAAQLAFGRISALHAAQSVARSAGGSSQRSSRTRSSGVGSPALVEARAALAASLTQVAVLAELQHAATVKASAALMQMEAVAAADERRAQSERRRTSEGGGGGSQRRSGGAVRLERVRAHDSRATPLFSEAASLSALGADQTRTHELERALALEQRELEQQLRITRELRLAQERAEAATRGV